MNHDYYLQKVEKFARSLSQIWGGSVELRNAEGDITGPDITKSTSHRMVYKRLFTMVAASETSQAVEIPGGGQVGGIPIMLDSEELRTIVVCHSRSFDHTPLKGSNHNTIINEVAEQSTMQCLIAVIEEYLKGLSDHYLNEIEMGSFSRELSLRYEELNFLYEIGAKNGQVEDFKQSLNYILRKAVELVDAEHALMHVPSKRIIDSVDSPKEESPDYSVDERLLRKVTSRIRRILQDDLEYLTESDLKRYPSIASYFERYGRVLIIPIRFEEKIEGILLFSRVHSREKFTSSDKRLITLTSDIVAMKIANAELFKDLNDFLMSLIKSFVMTIEEKDVYTRGHSERVNKYALKIGSALDLDAREIKSLNFASLLHDIGKIGIPEEGILKKSGPLTDEEYAVIKQHPVKGYKILKPIKQLKDCLPGILYHHERLDGKGYPEGIPGSKIPLSAKIIAVADTYDAMTSNRAYRRAIPVKEVMQEMLHVSGTELDGEITRLFIEKCLSTVKRKNKSF